MRYGLEPKSVGDRCQDMKFGHAGRRGVEQTISSAGEPMRSVGARGVKGIQLQNIYAP